MRRALVALAVVTWVCAPASAKPPACYGRHASIEIMERLDAHTLRLCWQDPSSCFTLDVDAKSPAWKPAARRTSYPAFHRTPIPGVTVGMTVNVCGTDGNDCRDFVVPPAPVDTLDETWAVANADRSLIAAVNWETVTLFDSKGGKRGTIASWRACVNCEGWSFDGIWFYGDRIYVEMHAGDKAELRVFDTKGAKIADLGDVPRVPPLALAGGTIVVATAFGESLDVRDKLGNRTKLVAVFGPPPSRDLAVSAVETALTRDGHVAIARADGSVALVDVATGGHTIVTPPPECK